MTKTRELFKQDSTIICKLIRTHYSNLTNGLSDQQIINDIVTVLLARHIKPKAHNKLHKVLDKI